MTFLYTYRGPAETRVLDLARQVNDLLRSTGVAGQPVRMVVIGDRDYRTDAAWRRDRLALTRRAQAAPYRLELTVRLWEANEIENYLLDVEALAGALHRQAAAMGVERELLRCRTLFGDACVLAAARLAAGAGLPLRIVDAEIIDAMAAVPDDVQKVLRELRRITNSARPTARRTHLDRYDKPPITRLTDDALRMARHSAANRSDRPSAASG